ncbi:hypothetical protein [Rossellomorea marisflavi]|uniref:hypothetical protein n=1 Tax=Rossellomorea marisflavi TaxID=189381 RepID=UPI0009A73979|nr:hypothetical protein [Rossellomorea marisflavi]
MLTKEVTYVFNYEGNEVFETHFAESTTNNRVVAKADSDLTDYIGLRVAGLPATGNPYTRIEAELVSDVDIRDPELTFISKRRFLVYKLPDVNRHVLASYEERDEAGNVLVMFDTAGLLD